MAKASAAIAEVKSGRTQIEPRMMAKRCALASLSTASARTKSHKAESSHHRKCLQKLGMKTALVLSELFLNRQISTTTESIARTAEGIETAWAML